jgi:hypothetical protein
MTAHRDTTPAIEELLAQPAWIRGLAQSLVADSARADDLVQASWLAALRGDYQLVVWNMERALIFTTDKIPAGTRDVLVSMPVKDLRPAIEVQVTDTDTVEGSQLYLRFASPRLEALAGDVVFPSPLQLISAGKISLEGLPQQDLVLEVDGPDLKGATLNLPVSSPLNSFQVPLAPLTYMRFIPGALFYRHNLEEVELEARNPAGQPISMTYIDHFGRAITTTRLKSGLFDYPDFLVDGSFVELVLFKDGVDMAHISAVAQSLYGLNQIEY